MDDNMQLWEVLRVLEERVGRSAGGGSERRCKFTGGGGSGGAQRGKWRRLNRLAGLEVTTA
jgi:hypothetical protein